MQYYYHHIAYTIPHCLLVRFFTFSSFNKLLRTEEEIKEGCELNSTLVVPSALGFIFPFLSFLCFLFHSLFYWYIIDVEHYISFRWTPYFLLKPAVTRLLSYACNWNEWWNLAFVLRTWNEKVGLLFLAWSQTCWMPLSNFINFSPWLHFLYRKRCLWLLHVWLTGIFIWKAVLKCPYSHVFESKGRERHQKRRRLPKRLKWRSRGNLKSS